MLDNVQAQRWDVMRLRVDGVRVRILLWGEENARALLWSWDRSVDTNNFGADAVGARRLSVAANLDVGM